MELTLLECGADAENAAALAWARRRGWALRVVDGGSPDAPAIAAHAAVWCHAGSDVPSLAPAVRDALAVGVAGGARVLLTLLAVPLASALGAPGDAPRVELPRPWRHADDPRWPDAFRDWPDYPHVRGFQAWGEHPLFTGLQRGTFSWMAREGDAWTRAVFERPRWPSAHVIAVDRSYVHLDPDTAVAWEYELGKGRVTCLGANIAFLSGDPLLAAQRDAVLENALRDAGTGSPGASRVAWPGAERRHAPVAPNPRPRAIAPPVLPITLPGAIETAAPDERPVTLGSRHALLVGSTLTGVREVWLHPLCVLDGGIGLATDVGDLIAERTITTAGHLERSLATPHGGRWHEVVTASVDDPEVHYALVPPDGSGAHGTVGLELRLPLRLEWPFAPDALAPLRSECRRDGERATVVVTGCDGRHAAALFADGVEDLDLREDDTAPTVKLTSRPGAGLRLTLRATTAGARGLGTAGAGVGEALRQHARRLDALREGAVCLTSDRPELDRAWTLALTRLANFVAGAPATGDGLMAGYAGTRGGWNVSRPGYAWFFGRDACWSVDALLAAGLFDEARVTIDLLARTADVSGKVIHELTTSGVAHYDAADSTPLFLRAVARYAHWTGDRDAIGRWWRSVQGAFAFVLSCDRDGDGLPENTGIGHGWIEMGPLGGGAVTSYVAAVWVDALQHLAPVAAWIGDPELADQLRAALVAATSGLGALRLPNGRLALHRDHAGRLAPDLTAMAAVPVALGLEAPASMIDTTDALAGPEFSAPWGLRMPPPSDPRYDPAGYHAGSVWPLFTGWAALADARAGRLDRALGRLVAIATHATARGTGGFAEVLHGDTGEPCGVCPDQAWSAAMLVAPLVDAVAGIRPEAFAMRCSVRPALPHGLGSLELERVRVGESRLTCGWSRGAGGVRLGVDHRGGPPLDIVVQGAHPAVRRLHDGERAEWTAPDESPGSPRD